MTVIALADLFGISGRREELAVVLATAERAAREQPGCVRYSFAATIDDPDHVVLVGEWRDQASLDEHYRSQVFASYQLALDGLLARPSEMTVNSVSEVVRPVASGPMDPRDAD